MAQEGIAGTLCGFSLCGILIAGLWPFSPTRNEVTWLANRNGVQFGEHGTILSAASFIRRTVGPCSIEMLLRPHLTQASSSLLAFYGDRGTWGLSLHQSITDLRLDLEGSRESSTKIYVSDVFHAGEQVFLTIVTTRRETTVYRDGAVARSFPEFDSGEACSSSLVVGDSPKESDSWQGELRGLAIYRQPLTPEQVMENYRLWTTAGRPAERGRVEADALYLFDEKKGQVIRDHGTSGVNLWLPEHYLVVRPTLWQRPWNEFEPTWSYVEDIMVNVGGFVPLGLTLSVLVMQRVGGTRVAISTVLAGFLLSLLIETLQVYLPTRNSDLTDVATNTFGTWLGVMVNRRWIRLGT